MKSQAERQREYRARLKGKNVTCNISNEAFELLRKECERSKKTRSQVLDSAIMYYLNNRKQMDLFSRKEPEVCKACKGYGCKICNESGWIE